MIMASQPLDAGSGYSALPKYKKRRAGDDFEKQESAKKKSESWYQKFNRTFLSNTRDNSEDDDTEDSSDDDIPVYPLKPLTAEERVAHNKRVAELVDLSAAKYRSEEADVKFKQRNPSFNLSITSKSEEWSKIRTHYMNELKGKSVKTIMDKENIHLDDVPENADGTEGNLEGKYKYLQLIPSQTDGVILDIQTENTELYKTNLASDKFKGVHDNIATKLTMLHFGLPVEPLTLNNILNADKDEDDEADPPEELPRVQRIIYSEKPLEFLDSYHDRSYGYPMLRSAYLLSLFAA